MTLIIQKLYDHDRMMKKIDAYPDTFIEANNFSNIDNIKNTLINGVYNMKIKEENRLILK
jgi:hypothetical protein